jgi:hypothetical protein
MPRRLTPALFAALVVLHLVPIWSVRRVPTSDGPSHVYNAWVMQALVRGTAPPAVAENIALRATPVPNLAAHVLLAAAVAVAGPPVGEKLFLTLLLGLLAAGAWALTRCLTRDDGSAASSAALLVLPLLYTWPLQMGFYGFMLGIACDLFLYAWLWRRREAAWRRVVPGLTLFFLAAYACHPIALVMAVLGVGALSAFDLGSLGWRGALARGAATLPALALAAGFALARTGAVAPHNRHLTYRVSYLAEFRSLLTLSSNQEPLARVAVGILIVAILAALTVRPAPWRDRPALPFLALSLLFAAVYFVAPDGGFGGSLVVPRLALYLPLPLLPWLARRLPKAAEIGLAAALTVWSLAHLAVLVPSYRAADVEISAYLAGLASVPNGQSLRVLDPPEAEEARVTYFLHAAGTVAAEKKLLLLPNYELESDLFPLRWRVEGSGDGGSMPVIDYVYGRPPEDDRARRDLKREFAPVATTDTGWVLYRRRDPPPERGTKP